MRSRIIRLLPLVGLVLLVAVSCQRFQSQPVEPTPTPSPTAVPATPTPTATPPPAPTPTPSAGTEIIDGRPYIREPLQGAILRYEIWIPVEKVQQLEQAYTLAQRVLQREVGIQELPSVDIYLSTASETVRFARARDFQHPAWLGGFYYYLVRDGEVVDAEIFVNATEGSIPHTVGHEMTHLATPTAPAWLSESIAEYVGSRVGMTMEPLSEEQRVLQTRSTVRRAASNDALLTFQELAQFEWNAIDDFRLLELVYAQSWHLTEYIASRFGPDSFARLLALYDDDLPQSEDPFIRSLGVSSDTLWTGFTADILENLMEQERVGLSLCGLGLLREQSQALAFDWNRFAPLTSFRDPEELKEEFEAFGLRWRALLDEAALFQAPSDAAPIRDLFAAHVQAMVQAMDYFRQQEVAAANDALSRGNDLASQAFAALNEAIAQRPWLTC